MGTRLKTTSKAINNKTLYNEIDSFMIELFSIEGIDWWTNPDHREQVALMVEDYLAELAHVSGRIDQYEVICDRRNNPRTINTDQPVNFTVKYRQKNCLNVSQIDYSFSKI